MQTAYLTAIENSLYELITYCSEDGNEDGQGSWFSKVLLPYLSFMLILEKDL